MKIKTTSYDEIKKMILQPITKEDVTFFRVHLGGLFDESIAEQEEKIKITKGNGESSR